MITSLLLIPLIGILILLLEPSFAHFFSGSKTTVGWQNVENKSSTIFTNSLIASSLTLDEYNSNERIKKIALFTSLINLMLSIIMWFQFDPNSSNYQFVSDFGYLSSATHLQISDSLSFCHFHVGVDGISLYFVLLTTFITPVCILSN